jgi:class III cytochrome C family protein
MIRMLSVALATCLFAAPVFAAEAPAKPVVLKSAKQGDVTFHHATHKDAKCMACHTTDAGGKVEALHAADAKEKQKGAHALCVDCHKKDAAKKAPTKCTDCHKKAK